MPITAEQLKNKDWRLKNLYKITSKEGKLIKFQRNRAQTHFNQNKAARNIILKSRQLGFTTDETIDSLDDVLWNPNYKALMLSYDKESAVEIFDDKIVLAWDNYPEVLKNLYKLDADRANKLKFDFGDNTYSSIIVRTKGRSGTFQRIHISEFAKICKESPSKAKEIIRGTLPAAPSGARVDIESTAEGEDGEFYEMFWEAWDRGEPKSPLEFKAHFFNWTWDDDEIAKTTEALPTNEMEQSQRFKEYQEKHKLTDLQITYYYYKWRSLNRDWSALMQEYPTTPEEAFVSSGHKLFDIEQLSRQKSTLKVGEKVGSWTYYDDYRPNHRYALGADVAEGVGQDSSAIVVMDFTGLKPRTVATYRDNQIPPDLFAHEIKNGATRYGNCLVAPERNSIGIAVVIALKQIYHNIYRQFKQDEIEDKQVEKLGWHTNSATKPKMLYDLSTAINEDAIEVISPELMQEMRTYDKEDLRQVRFDDEQTKHWDLLMAMAICYQMRDQFRTRSNKSFTNKPPRFR